MFDQTEPSPGITSHENPSAGFTVKRFTYLNNYLAIPRSQFYHL